MEEAKTEEQVKKEYALINGKYENYLVDEDGNRRTQQEAIREITKDLLVIQSKAKLVLAEMLFTIHKEEFFYTWGYDSFQEYVQDELQFQYRQAMYLVEIWKTLRQERGIPIEVMRKSSWSKLKEIARASKQEDVKTDDIENLIESSSELTVEEVSYESKKLTYESMTEGGEEGDDKEKPEKLHKVTLSLYDEQYENFQKAISCAQDVSGSTITSANMDLICTEYIASHIAGSSEDELKRIVKQLEKSTGSQIVVAKDDKIIHANEAFSDIEENKTIDTKGEVIEEDEGTETSPSEEEESYPF